MSVEHAVRSFRGADANAEPQGILDVPAGEIVHLQLLLVGGNDILRLGFVGQKHVVIAFYGVNKRES